MSEDIPYTSISLNILGLHIDDSELEDYVLYELEGCLNHCPKSLTDVGIRLPPEHLMSVLRNGLLMEEKSYDRRLLVKERDRLLPKLNDKQRHIFNLITNACLNKQELVFVYGHSGTGKMFLWKTIIYALRSEGKIVLIVASSEVYHLEEVYHFAEVYHLKEVYHFAEDYHYADVFHFAEIYHFAEVYHLEEVYHFTKVYHFAEVYHFAKVYHFAEVYHFDFAEVYHFTAVCHFAEVYHSYSGLPTCHSGLIQVEHQFILFYDLSKRNPFEKSIAVLSKYLTAVCLRNWQRFVQKLAAVYLRNWQRFIESDSGLITSQQFVIFL
ncbi:DNA helicase [Tanacetum coccineum]